MAARRTGSAPRLRDVDDRRPRFGTARPRQHQHGAPRFVRVVAVERDLPQQRNHLIAVRVEQPVQRLDAQIRVGRKRRRRREVFEARKRASGAAAGGAAGAGTARMGGRGVKARGARGEGGAGGATAAGGDGGNSGRRRRRPGRGRRRCHAAKAERGEPVERAGATSVHRHRRDSAAARSGPGASARDGPSGSPDTGARDARWSGSPTDNRRSRYWLCASQKSASSRLVSFGSSATARNSGDRARPLLVGEVVLGVLHPFRVGRRSGERHAGRPKERHHRHAGHQPGPHLHICLNFPPGPPRPSPAS